MFEWQVLINKVSFIIAVVVYWAYLVCIIGFIASE